LENRIPYKSYQKRAVEKEWNFEYNIFYWKGGFIILKENEYLQLQKFCLGLFLMLLFMIAVTFFEFSANPTLFSANRTYSTVQILLFLVVFISPFIFTFIISKCKNAVLAMLNLVK